MTHESHVATSEWHLACRVAEMQLELMICCNSTSAIVLCPLPSTNLYSYSNPPPMTNFYCYTNLSLTNNLYFHPHPSLTTNFVHFINCTAVPPFGCIAVGWWMVMLWMVALQWVDEWLCYERWCYEWLHCSGSNLHIIHHHIILHRVTIDRITIHRITLRMAPPPALAAILLPQLSLLLF